MKKHLLGLSVGVAACAFAGTAYAQSNSAYTNQYGNGGGINTIVLNQNDDGNGGQVGANGAGNNQIGNSNNAFVQSGSQNGLIINQTGSKNTFGAQGSIQQGTGNKADVRQSGYDSRVELRQYGDFGGVNSYSNNQNIPGGSSNLIEQSTDQGLGNNSISLLQRSGSNNEFNLRQIGGYNNSQVVDQTGYANQAATFQGYGTNAGSIAITQNGDHNYAAFSQFGATGADGYPYGVENGSSISVTQVGNRNSASGTQSGFKNAQLIGQYGSSNVVTTLQDAATANAQMTIFQYNNDNKAYLTQTGATGTSYINAVQNGGDTLTANQSGLNNHMDSYQYGTNNTATLSQDAATSDSSMLLTQYDSNNTATLTQVAATGSHIIGTQSGYNNVANVTQTGANQTMNFVQSGNMNSVIARQH